MHLVLIGTEQYLKGIKPFDRLIERLNEYEWYENIDTFDEDMQA